MSSHHTEKIGTKKYFKYWGKADKASSAYHPLVYHSMDVAAVGRLLADRLHIAQRAADLLKCDLRRTNDFIAFLCAIHDIGKFAEGFQSLRPDLYKILNGQIPNSSYQERHWSLGYRFLCENTQAISSLDKDLLLDALSSWLSASAGHHGRPPKNALGMLSISHQFSPQALGDAIEFMEDARGLFNADDFFKVFDGTGNDESIFKRLSWNLAGLIVLADWIGSNRSWFPYRMEMMRLEDYWEKYAVPQAMTAVKEAHVLPLPTSERCSIGELFPNIATPTPLQRRVENLSLVPGPKLFIMEEVTGAGKTEAALVLAQRIMASGEADGIYFGLPTMATANAMHARVDMVYRKLYVDDAEPSLVLAHSASRQSLAIERGYDEQNYADDDECAGRTSRNWLFDNRKKVLLANVGVGTIDQALLAVLPVRHQSLRLLGLYRKVFIVDEVHAYDSYMNGLLCNLLKFHAAQGGSAILLSATLPRKLRADFIQAFADGMGCGFSGVVSEDYPLLTAVAKDNFGEMPLNSPVYLHREVLVKPVYDKEEIQALVSSAVQSGKNVCWVRNTVFDAMEAYELVSEQLDEAIVTLFHARFALGDRLLVEKKIIGDFGPESVTETRRGKVVIATQVVEQSLDLDFDFMISDLAPIDLIIQRAGRLCRHRRDGHGNRIDEEDQRGIPKMVVYMPRADGRIESDWYSAVFPKAARVYEHHGLLWLTAKWLADNKRFQMPNDARAMIEYVYGDGSGEHLPPQLVQQENRADGNDRAKQSMAGYQKLKLEDGYTADMLNWPQDEKAPTRIGTPSTTVRLAVWENGILEPYFQAKMGNDWALSEVSVYQALVTHEDETDCKAIDAVKKTMPDKGKFCVVIPLKKNGNYREGYARDAQNQKVKVSYDSKWGLRVERRGDSDESD